MGEKSFVFGNIFTDPIGFFVITVILCPKNTCFWPVLVKIRSRQFKKTHISTQFDEIFQMVPILIWFDEKKFWRYLSVRVPPVVKYLQKFFSSNHINMGTIWKISSNWVEICVFLYVCVHPFIRFSNGESNYFYKNELSILVFKKMYL